MLINGENKMSEFYVGTSCHGRKDCFTTPTFMITEDPYDAVSGSPIMQPTWYCIDHYNERVIAAIKFAAKQFLFFGKASS